MEDKFGGKMVLTNSPKLLKSNSNIEFSTLNIHFIITFAIGCFQKKS